MQLPAGKATPAPPVGTMLGPTGINSGDFCNKYNEATKDRMGDIIPVEVTIYEDRSFDFITKTPPTGSLLKKAAKLQKGSTKGAHEVVAVLTPEQIKEIAEIKMPDLNCYDIEAAIKIVSGTARNMGIAIKGVNDAELQEAAKEAAVAEAEAAKAEAEEAALEAENKAEGEVPTVAETEEKEETNEEPAEEEKTEEAGE